MSRKAPSKDGFHSKFRFLAIHVGALGAVSTGRERGHLFQAFNGVQIFIGIQLDVSTPPPLLYCYFNVLTKDFIFHLSILDLILETIYLRSIQLLLFHRCMFQQTRSSKKNLKNSVFNKCIDTSDRNCYCYCYRIYIVVIKIFRNDELSRKLSEPYISIFSTELFIVVLFIVRVNKIRKR